MDTKSPSYWAFIYARRIAGFYSVIEKENVVTHRLGVYCLYVLES